ncbi:trypco2 family protein [Streptomyces hirsutus]|uniref:trypco2 family protein n=1 Tax=Streptomyces hirsutus TaxID=35620 RepID=UPI0036427CF7
MSQEPWTGLAETISAVRAELEQAMEDGRDHPISFRTGPVEMEFAVDVRKNGEARAKVMVLPWSAEAKAGYAAATTSRLKITLQPVDPDGEDQKINADSPERPK